LAAVPVWGNTRVHGNRAAFGVLAALACALIALAVPALASARSFVVDGTGDVQAGDGCVNPLDGECTLPGAIEAANVDSTRDVITFASAFNGEVAADQIDMTTPLPAIVEPVAIEGASCFQPGHDAPCVGLSAASGEDAFVVEANGVQISGLSITGDEAGIEVPGGSTGFVATGDWIGLRLDGSPGGSISDGIYLGPGADGAQIGGVTGDAVGETTARNVFANDEVGVLVEGASRTKILGNYIGVGPGGASAPMEIGVRIVDGPGSPAEDNEVGGARGTGGATGMACDGACNAITTESGDAVDLFGPEEPSASGPTVVRGNFIGLAPDGSGTVGDNFYGVLALPGGFSCAEGPADVTIGGTAPSDANYIAGGGVGIYAQGTENFSAIGNAIGLAPNGRPTGAPTTTGIGLCLYEASEGAHVADNRVAVADEATGIESEWGHASIAGNRIEGGLFGISTGFGSEGPGDTVSANRIIGSDQSGIRIPNESNLVTGNSVIGSGWAGIQLEDGADQNRIGGDLPGEANTIDGSRWGAIQVEGPEFTRNEIAANTGSGNAEAFIQLIGGGDEFPNGGIKRPAIATALQSRATGTAEPGATVRVFSKASADPGELGNLLAAVTADGAGNWVAPYATVPTGTLVAATQTSGAGTPEGATSEVSAPVAAAADPVEPVEPGGGGSNDDGSSTATPQPPPPPTPDAPAKPRAPKVTITKGPKKSSTTTTAKFTFKAIPAAGAKFQCKLDKAKWVSCKSPKTYRNLKPRRHTFQVRASASGVTSPAAKFKFTVRR
jgi:hypothetical protein